MRILFILGMFHPRYSANGVCCQNVIDECIRRGWKVDCVVNSYLGNYKQYEVNGATVYPIKPRLSYRIIEKGEAKKYGAISTAAIRIGNLLNRAQLFVHQKRWPLVSKAYTESFFRKAKELLREENYDFIIAAYTPIDCVLAAARLKRCFPKVRFIPYYLDALAGGWGPHSWTEEKRELSLRKWETIVDADADRIFSMLSAKDYHEKKPLSDFNSKRIFLDVPMMLEPIYTNSKHKEDKVLLYAGNISYPRRNPIPLLNSLELLFKMGKYTVLFAGTINNPSIFEPYLNRTNGRIRLLGQLSHDKLIELEKEIDCFINLGSDNPNTIPCKIFEYMRFGKPIISTYSIDNEPSKQYLNRYVNSLCIDEREAPEDNAKRMFSFLLEERASVDFSLLLNTFYYNTPGAFADTLEGIKDE